MTDNNQNEEDGTLPGEELLQSRRDSEVESWNAVENAQEEIRQSTAVQLERHIWKELLATVEVDETEIKEALDDYESIMDQWMEDIKTKVPAPITDTKSDFDPLEKIIGDTSPFFPIVPLSPLQSKVDPKKKGGEEEEPSVNVQIGEQRTTIEAKVFAKGTGGDTPGSGGTHSSDVLIKLYYRMTPPANGILTVSHYPSLHGSYTLSPRVGWDTAGRVFLDYTFNAYWGSEEVTSTSKRIVEAKAHNQFKWVDLIHDRFTNSFPVVKDEPVHIYFGIRMRAAARSNSSWVELDFLTDTTTQEGEIRDQHISIPRALCTLTPSG
ncbi:hypothetical protein [Natronococcus wangiae]|uniref:hypothetical protein n=1 Tax=Natronococcus wangiae TaxID=3068275 RepID=UPI00273E8F6F|nr:hypothetical protein [Natronococcus sp. AD5]